MTTENWLTLIGIVASAVGGYLVKYFLDKKAQFSSQNAQIKRKMYQDYVNFVLKFIDEVQNQKQSDATPQQQVKLIKSMKEFHRQAVLYSSPRVVNAYSDMLQNSYRNNQSSSSSYFAMVLMTNIFKEMRRDIGLSNRGLKGGAIRLVRPMINDYDDKIRPVEVGLLSRAKSSLINGGSQLGKKGGKK